MLGQQGRRGAGRNWLPLCWGVRESPCPVHGTPEDHRAGQAAPRAVPAPGYQPGPVQEPVGSVPSEVRGSASALPVLPAAAGPDLARGRQEAAVMAGRGSGGSQAVGGTRGEPAACGTARAPVRAPLRGPAVPGDVRVGTASLAAALTSL